MSNAPATKQIPLPVLQWILWSAITAGLIVIYVTIGQRPPPPATRDLPPILAYVALGPLLLSAAVRWLFLPRIDEPPKRLPIFILGIALAESCGILGIFIGGTLKDTFVVLSLLGLAQFFPAFLPRTTTTPASSFR